MAIITSTRGLTRRWCLRETPGDRVTAGPLRERILTARGLVDPDTIARFCEPRLSHLADPRIIHGLETAAHRIIRALQDRQRIVIYGDYDVDGIAATAILERTMRAIQPDVAISRYIPHRLEEGYGLNSDALRQLRSEGADLVITVDCGITAIESARIAKEIGLDLIITDHHQPANSGQLPDAILVHPGLGDDTSLADLSGAGVAFKLAWQIAREHSQSERVSEKLRDVLLHLLPLAALATIADVVPLRGENRILTMFGLRMIRHTPHIGLRALIEASQLADSTIDCEKVGFILAPQLNAIGRMGHAADAARLLADHDLTPTEAHRIAAELIAHNRKRQSTTRTITDQAMKLAEDLNQLHDDHRVIVLADDRWHPGVIGIAASRLVDKYSRPAILLQRDNGICRGSARSIDGFNLHAALCACAAHLSTFGGHEMAAGLSLEADQLDAFTTALRDHANEHITPDQLTPAITIDTHADLHELDLDTVQQITQLSPFGRGNPRPIIHLRHTTLAEAPKQIGQHGNHLSLRLRAEHETTGRRFFMRGVWWRQGQRAADLAAGMPLDLAIEPKLNTWNGRTNVEAEIKDISMTSA